MKPLLTAFFALLFITTKAADSIYTERPDTLHTRNGDLYGTLMLPKQSKGKIPVALIISGSGPTDRDGNSIMLPGKNNSLLYLAQALAAKGIASLRFDKRGIGQSRKALGREADLRFEDYIRDAQEWLEKLKATNQYRTYWVIGHSEGSLIGMAIAPGADGFISLAGAGAPAPRILKTQLAALPDSIKSKAFIALDSLENGYTVKHAPIQLFSLFRPSVQPYLISWFRYDPRQLIARLKCPVLLIQGDKDVQVSVADVEALKAAAPEAKLLIVPRMNHVLKIISSGNKDENQRAYSDPTLPLAPELAASVTVFIR